MIIYVAESVRDRILIVENDPLVADLLTRQSLQAAGYQTQVIVDATTAINRTIQMGPDAIIVNLNLPGLSGKDLMVALTSQGVNTPVIVLARKGQEADIMQAFRLGAVDYMIWPLKEPEVITVVERALRSVRERKEREQLSRQLQRTNAELQSRVRELTTIFAVGKAVTSITDQELLCERILEGATRVLQADLGWFLLRVEDGQPFLLAAQRGLPPSMMDYAHKPWDDGISSLVALSGEALSIHGEPVKRFKISGLGQAALIVPVRVQKQVTGLLVVMRKAANPFSPGEQHLLEAVADYASISLVNARLFRAVEERARKLETLAAAGQTGEKINHSILLEIKNELRRPLTAGMSALEKLTRDPAARWTQEQRQNLLALQEQLQTFGRIGEAINPPKIDLSSPGRAFNLSELAQGACQRFQPLAAQANLALVCEAPAGVMAEADPDLIRLVLGGLISNAIKFSQAGGRVTVRVEVNAERQAHLMVSDSGPGLDPKQFANLFASNFQPPPHIRARRFGGLGISLALAKELMSSQNGKIWVETQPGAGATFHLALPPGFA